MASFKKAMKSKQRDHKERSQLGFRKHLGLLEKKKDYKLRADDYHRKQKTILALRQKAMDKNPDEFNFKMIHSQLQDGVHVIAQEDEVVTMEQKKLMCTQDIRYVEMKRVSEMKKIERMKSELHLIDEKKNNKHTFFLETKKEVKNFDLATHLNTFPELVHRAYNRPTIETLKTKSILGAVTSMEIKKLAKKRRGQYGQLSQRINREKEMFIVSQKIQTRKDLQEKVKKVKVRKETKTAPAIYRFEAKRKK